MNLRPLGYEDRETPPPPGWPEFGDAALAQQVEEEIETFRREAIVSGCQPGHGGWARPGSNATKRRRRDLRKESLEVKGTRVIYARSSTAHRLARDRGGMRLRAALHASASISLAGCDTTR